MKMDDALELVNERLTYKKGWVFLASENTWSSWTMNVHIEFVADNSSPRDRDARRKVLADHTFVVDINNDEGAVLAQILTGICDAETHETREFMRVDGEAPFHPHSFDGQDMFEDQFPSGVQTQGS